MDTQTQAQLFLADQRGCSQTDFFRSYHTFNFGHYKAEGREPFGPLCLLNDDTLRAGAKLSLGVEHPTAVVLLPVVGSLEYTSEAGDGFLEPGQVGLLSLPTGSSYTINNPYDEEAINFLQFWLTHPAIDTPTFAQFDFNLSTQNTLLPLFGMNDPQPAIQGFIGQFGGREEGTYTVSTPTTSGVYVFALQGAFEVQNRLLHNKDGLSLRTIQDGIVEFEALSNEAILIILEVG